MRLRLASAFLLFGLDVLAAGDDVLVRSTREGVIVRIRGVDLEDCRLVEAQPPRVVLAVDGARLVTRVVPNRTTWLRSLRVIGSEILGAESRVVVEMTSSLPQPRLEQSGSDVLLVIDTSGPARASAEEPAPADEAPPPPRERSEPRRRSREPAAEEEDGEEETAAEAEPAEPPAAPARQPWRDDVPGMVLVPGGTAIMGAVEGTSHADESPAHLVRLRAFRIDAREVSADEFAASPLPMPRQPEWSVDGANPVVNVTWNEAAEYCEWAGKRLPTEAEWERAARGEDGRTYPWGSDWSAILANSGLDGDGFEHLSPGGAFPRGASPHGALDMAGNAWEWTSDWYARDGYSHARMSNPDGPGRGSHKVARGGSFRSRHAPSVTTTVRLPLPAGARRDDVGFRCVD